MKNTSLGPEGQKNTSFKSKFTVAAAPTQALINNFEEINLTSQIHWSVWEVTCHGQENFFFGKKINAGVEESEFLQMHKVSNNDITGRARLIRSHSSARFRFELSRNLN